jgi:hypothetical protein
LTYYSSTTARLNICGPLQLHFCQTCAVYVIKTLSLLDTLIIKIFNSNPKYFPLPLPQMDPSVQFLTSPATMVTTTFLNHYKHSILLSESALNHLDMVLNRFMVTAILLNKHTALTSQHEYLSINVYDSHFHQSHLVFLK